jgi:hypothetical protein
MTGNQDWRRTQLPVERYPRTRVGTRSGRKALDGVVRYVGARDGCTRRAKILIVASDRRVQDAMLGRALLTT